MQSTTISLTRSRGRFALRVLGAMLLLFVGADRYYEYSVDQYSVLPTIGTLFLLNFISATVFGLLLLGPASHPAASVRKSRPAHGHRQRIRHRGDLPRGAARE